MTGRILVDRKLRPNLNLRNAIREWIETCGEKEREDAARHERDAEEAARVEEEKARQVSTTHAQEEEDAARVASIEAEAAARVESLQVMVARVEAHMAGRVREAEEAARVATARVQEAEEAARVVARRAEEEVAARVESLQVMVARVEAESAVRVESLQVRVNNHHGYRQKMQSTSVSECFKREGCLCETWPHVKKMQHGWMQQQSPKEKLLQNPQRWLYLLG